MIVIGIVVGFLTGIYLYKINQIDKKTENLAEIKVLNNNLDNSNFIATNTKEVKTSPNCIVILKLYYNKCEHLIEQKQKIEANQVNLTEKEIKEKFSEWELQKFNAEEIVLYREIDGICDEHYLLKDKDGYIGIYKLDENDNTTFIKKTDIATEYLTTQDLQNVKNGIKVITKTELNKTLEDFE